MCSGGFIDRVRLSGDNILNGQVGLLFAFERMSLRGLYTTVGEEHLIYAQGLGEIIVFW